MSSSSEENHTVSLKSDILDELNTDEAKALHKLTDNLSSCGVGRIVNLPQIIVVGEQSAGKSSVLEAITRVRFPVHSGVCTRFATELVLRRSAETSVDVSVRYAARSAKSETFQRKGFRDEDLPDIIKEARKCMNLPESSKEFSKDVLRLEISGPNMFPLTLVDLPGLYDNDTTQQSEEGIAIVDQLVGSYMKQPSSIILVVVPAVGDIASHSALRKVKKYDPKLERTLGLVTKPDLAQPGLKAEKTHISLARNEDSTMKLKLGWHVLRNRAEDEDSLDARDAKEAAFFESGAWASLPPKDRGVASLRKRLSGVLLKHIQNDLGRVVDDIEERLKERREELDRLGPARSESRQQRTFLLDIAQRFHSLAECGIDGRYNGPFFGNLNDTEYKFRANLRNFNNAFDHVLSVRGSKLQIVSPKNLETGAPSVPDHLQPFVDMYSYHFRQPKLIPLKDLHTRLEKQAASNQGREFRGSPNRDLVVQLFQDQASPWKGIASFHIEQITLLAKAFVDQIFRHVGGQPDVSRTTEGILRNYVDTFFAEKEVLLNEKLSELLRPFERGYAMPQDSEFQSMMQKRHSERLSAWLAANTVQGPNGREPEMTESLLNEAILELEGSNEGHFGTGKVIDMMQAYYEMSRRTFTDNVINLAVESCLIAHLPDILTAQKVDQMADEELEVLAGDSDDTRARRKQLEEEKEILQEGLETCRKHKPRGLTIAPFARSSPSPARKDTPSNGETSRKLFQTETTKGGPAFSLPSDEDEFATDMSKDKSSSGEAAKGKSKGSGTTATNGIFSNGGLFGSSPANNSGKSLHEAAQPANSFSGFFSSQKPSTTASSEYKWGESAKTGGLFGTQPTSSTTSATDGSQQPKAGSLFSGQKLFKFDPSGTRVIPSTPNPSSEQGTPQSQQSNQSETERFYSRYNLPDYMDSSAEEDRLYVYQRKPEGFLRRSRVATGQFGLQ